MRVIGTYGGRVRRWVRLRVVSQRVGAVVASGMFGDGMNHDNSLRMHLLSVRSLRD